MWKKKGWNDYHACVFESRLFERWWTENAWKVSCNVPGFMHALFIMWIFIAPTTYVMRSLHHTTDLAGGVLFEAHNRWSNRPLHFINFLIQPLQALKLEGGTLQAFVLGRWFRHCSFPNSTRKASSSWGRLCSGRANPFLEALRYSTVLLCLAGGCLVHFLTFSEYSN